MNKGDTVSLELSAEEIALKDQLEQNERVLASYENDLRAIDAELEQHLEKNHQYDVLSRICRSFEELDELGAANLFWDEQQHPENLDQRLRHAHRKIDEFGAEITALEKRRDSIPRSRNGATRSSTRSMIKTWRWTACTTTSSM
jgi:prefoldin subunit 5